MWTTYSSLTHANSSLKGRMLEDDWTIKILTNDITPHGNQLFVAHGSVVNQWEDETW
jgi:hypothetical protein